jgi:hypothetical protein
MRKLKVGHEILGELPSFEVTNNFYLNLERLILKIKKYYKFNLNVFFLI